MKKKLFAILMCLAMMLTFMPATAFAEGEDGGGISAYEIIDDELTIDQSVEMTMENTVQKCVRFVPEEAGVYSFVPSSDSSELPKIMGVLFDADWVQLGSWEVQPEEPNTNELAAGEPVYVSFFYEAEGESTDATYDITVSVEKMNDGGDDGGEGYEGDYEGSFEFDGQTYYYSRSEAADGEYAKEVVKGDTLTLSPFEAYRFWHLDDNEEEVTVDDPSDLFGEAFTYEWTRQNDETGEWEQICESAAYTKENAAESDAGYYECKVSYNNGDNDEELLYLNARVDIFNSVEIGGETYTYRLDPSWEARVMGQEVTLSSGAEFRDSNGDSVEPESLFSKIEWYRLTEEDGEKKETLVSGSGYDISSDGSLHIDKVTGEDYGEYICRMYYDNEKNIETSSGLTSALSQDMQVYVGLSELNSVGDPKLIYSGFTNATPGAKLTYQWYYGDLDSEDSPYTGPEEGNPIAGETNPSIDSTYGPHYYHCNITASMKGYGEDTTGSNLNYKTEIPDNYLDSSNSNFADITGGRVTASLVFNERESEYYSFKPAANKVYELTATCNSTITDPVEVAVSCFDSNGVRLGKDENDGYVNCTIDPSEAGTAVPVLTFESGSAAEPVYFAASISGSGSGRADVSLEITPTGDVPVYHVVEFETDNNDIMPSQLVKDEEKLTPESEPVKEGYSFSGWYTDAGCTAAFNLGTAITADMTLYAKWTEDDEGDEPGGTGVEVTDAHVSFANSISEEDKAAVSNVIAFIQDGNLVEAAKVAADELEVTQEEGLKALQSEGFAPDASAEDVSIVIQTYLDMEIQTVNRAEGSNKIKSVTIEITPKVSVIAVIDTDAVVVEEKPVTVNKETVVEIRLPEAFADSNVVYVWHNEEEYEALPKDGESATFVFSTNGFSPFVFSKEHTHKLTAHAEEAPTCETAGNSAYWSCNICGKYFSDADAENEIEEGSWVIEATGHTLVKVAATAKNYEYYKCSICGKCFSDAAGTKEISESSMVINATAKVKASTLPLKKKQKVSAAANLELPAGVSVKSVTSSNTKILTVSGITLKGKKKGKSVVTCTLTNGTTVSYTVKVQNGKVKAKITGVPKSLTLHVGETYQITADKGYVTCKDKLKYTSSKKKVAKVSKKGLITAKKKGTARITVKCGGKKKTIKVKVIS